MASLLAGIEVVRRVYQVATTDVPTAVTTIGEYVWSVSTTSSRIGGRLNAIHQNITSDWHTPLMHTVANGAVVGHGMTTHICRMCNTAISVVNSVIESQEVAHTIDVVDDDFGIVMKV